MRSLGVLLVAFIGLAAVQGCGSDSKGSNKSGLNTAGASGAAGSTSTLVGTGGSTAMMCNPMYCPTVTGTTPCCLQDGITCGMNQGNGCVPFGKPDAGAH